MRHKLHAITNTEDRDVQFKDFFRAEVCYRRNTQNPLDRVAGMTRSVGTYAELPQKIKRELEEAGQVEDAFKLLEKGR